MASLYHDRKMLKWLPFEALETHGEAIRSLYQERETTEKPVLSDDALATIERSRHVAHLYVFHTDSPSIVDLGDIFSTLVRSRGELRVQGGDFPGEWIVRTGPSEGSESPVMYVSNGAIGIVAIAR